jgi:hypothetical protein
LTRAPSLEPLSSTPLSSMIVSMSLVSVSCCPEILEAQSSRH